MSSQHRRHTVSLNTKVYTRLKNCGEFGESFSELINRLLDLTEHNDDLIGSKDK